MIASPLRMPSGSGKTITQSAATQARKASAPLSQSDRSTSQNSASVTPSPRRSPLPSRRVRAQPRAEVNAARAPDRSPGRSDGEQVLDVPAGAQRERRLRIARRGEDA